MGRRQRSTPFSLFSFQDIITSVTGILIMIMLILCLTLFKSESEETTEETVDLEEVQKQVDEKQLELQKMQAELKSVEKISTLAATLSPEEVREKLKTNDRKSKKIEEDISKLSASADQTKQDLNSSETAFAETETIRKKLEQLENTAKKATSELEKLKKSNRIAFSFTDADNVDAWVLDLNGQKTATALANKKMKPKKFDSKYESIRIEEIVKWAKTLNPRDTYIVFMVRSANVRAYKAIRAELEPKGFKFGVNLLGKDVQVLDPDTGAVAP